MPLFPIRLAGGAASGLFRFRLFCPGEILRLCPFFPIRLVGGAGFGLFSVAGFCPGEILRLCPSSPFRLAGGAGPAFFYPLQVRKGAFVFSSPACLSVYFGFIWFRRFCTSFLPCLYPDSLLVTYFTIFWTFPFPRCTIPLFYSTFLIL